MAIQGAINSLIGTAGAAATLGKHLEQQEKAQLEAEEAKEIEKAKVKAEAAATTQHLEESKKAYRNDTIEAAAAIGAHEKSFNPIVNSKEGLKSFDKLSPEEIDQLSETDINKLAGDVDKFRNEKLMGDRIYKMQQAASLPNSVRSKGYYLNKAYKSFRELNQRIEASRALEFDIKAATAKLEELKKVGGKE